MNVDPAPSLVLPQTGQTGLRLDTALALLRQAGQAEPAGEPGSAAYLQALIDQLVDLSSRDALTGLANRRNFELALGREVDRVARSGESALLLMVDIDHFKLYNDSLGHPQGDLCLSQVASLIQQLAKRPADEVARIGGEEFVVLLPETDAIGAAHVAQHIVEGVAAMAIPHPASPVSRVATVSIGVATVNKVPPRNFETTDIQPIFGSGDLILSADKALYMAKSVGRNRYHQADPLGLPRV